MDAEIVIRGKIFYRKDKHHYTHFVISPSLANEGYVLSRVSRFLIALSKTAIKNRETRKKQRNLKSCKRVRSEIRKAYE